MATLNSMVERVERTMQRNLKFRRRTEGKRKGERGDEKEERVDKREKGDEGFAERLFEEREKYLERMKLQREKIHWYKYGMRWKGSLVERLDGGK